MRAPSPESNAPSLVPAALGASGVSRMASTATLVGIQTPAESKNVELKPYAVSSVSTNHATAAPFDHRLDADAGTLTVAVADLEARPPAVADLSANAHGTGRELFAAFRALSGRADQGASIFEAA